MFLRFLADLTALVHFTFVLFVLFGGLIVLWHRRLIWVHLAAVIWGIFIEFSDWTCPLTPLENWLREKGGGAGYQGGFIDHYIMPLLYPAGLTRTFQLVAGCLVLAVNLIIYAWIYRKWKS